MTPNGVAFSFSFLLTGVDQVPARRVCAKDCGQAMPRHSLPPPTNHHNDCLSNRRKQSKDTKQIILFLCFSWFRLD